MNFFRNISGHFAQFLQKPVNGGFQIACLNYFCIDQAWMYVTCNRNLSQSPSRSSSVWLGLTSREQLMSLMSPECSKHQVQSFAKILVVWWKNKKYSVLTSVLQSAQWINSGCSCMIYIHNVVWKFHVFIENVVLQIF